MNVKCLIDKIISSFLHKDYIFWRSLFLQKNDFTGKGYP